MTMKNLLKTSLFLLLISFVMHFTSFTFAAPPTIDQFLGSLSKETVQTSKVKVNKTLKENIKGLLYPGADDPLL
jgi:hypothetical protein